MLEGHWDFISSDLQRETHNFSYEKLLDMGVSTGSRVGSNKQDFLGPPLTLLSTSLSALPIFLELFAKDCVRVGWLTPCYCSVINSAYRFLDGVLIMCHTLFKTRRVYMYI